MSTLDANLGATDLDLDLDTLARGADAATAGTARDGKPAAGAARAGKLAAAEVVTPAELDLAEKLKLEDALFDVHRRIFRDLDKARFVRIVVDSKAEHHWIQLYRDEHGALGGYAAVHIHEREIDGKPAAIVRCQSATLRAYRGANLVTGFIARRVLRYLVTHPRRSLYLFGAFVHPSSYSQLVRYCDDVWPREGAETPAHIRELVSALGDAYGFRRVDPANDLVRYGGWEVSDSRADRAYWEGCERPGVQFFLRENPGFDAGNGLLALAPLTLGTVARGLARNLHARSARSVRRLIGRTRAGIAGLLPERADS